MRPGPGSVPLRFGLAAVLGVGLALLVACGSSGSALIPAANAGPLQSELDDVANYVAQGDCPDANAAAAKAQQDLTALPGTVDPQLLETLTSGVQTLAERAATECKLNAGSSTTTTGQTTTPTQTTTTNTNTATNTVPTSTDTDTGPTDTNTDTAPPTDTGGATTPTDTSSTPATTTPPTSVGGTQAPGAVTVPFDPSGGTPGGGN